MDDRCYHGGAFFDAIGDGFEDLDRRDRIINADVLDAWFEPAPGVLDALREHLPWLLRTSPPTGCEGMGRAIAAARDLPPESILPGAGSSDLIFLVLREWLDARSRVLILDPMYGEYAHVLEQVIGCRVDRLALRREDDYDLDLARLAERVAVGYDLIVLVNPNSPTGRFAPAAELRDVLSTAPPCTRVWLDETYVDYVGAEHSLESFAAQSQGVVVCKSMSKVYALSGARAAYLCGPPALIDPLRPLSPPWSVGLPSQLAAVEALADPAYYRERMRETHALRASLARDLMDECALDVVDGVANFILGHLPEEGPNAATVVAACRREGLFIRDVSNMGRGLGDHVIRIAVKDAATNRRIVGILARAVGAGLAPQPAG